jgi:hypothetical protein
MGRNLAKNRYELDEVYVKSTRHATAYHHPECGHADIANYDISDAERGGYQPAACCLSGINTNRERFVLTDRAHKQLYQRAEEQNREPGDVASAILNQHFTPEEEGDSEHERESQEESERSVVAKLLQVIQ